MTATEAVRSAMKQLSNVKQRTSGQGAPDPTAVPDGLALVHYVATQFADTNDKLTYALTRIYITKHCAFEFYPFFELYMTSSTSSTPLSASSGFVSRRSKVAQQRRTLLRRAQAATFKDIAGGELDFAEVESGGCAELFNDQEIQMENTNINVRHGGARRATRRSSVRGPMT